MGTSAESEPITVDLVVDTSAAMAILLSEPGSDELITYLEAANTRLMSAATYLELSIVVEARLGPAAADIVPRFLQHAQIELVPVDADLAQRALGAWRRYGKGRHAAALNFGDCFTYGLADQSGCTILCVGSDFPATDLPVAGPIKQL